MIDTSKGRRLIVSDDGAGGAHVKLPVDELDAVRKVLDRNAINDWVDPMSIRIGNRPYMTVINVGLTGDAAHVQEILDEAH